jgi:hypothetical protein
MIVREETTGIDYYIERAREERARAATCGDQLATLVHLKLAAEYERRAGRMLVEG